MFRRRFPRDPLIPATALLLGRVALEQENVARARVLFGEAARSGDEVVRDRARFYDAVAQHRAGDSAGALRALEPLVGRTTDPDETTLLLRTLAEANESLGRRIQALRFWDRLVVESMPDDELATLRAGIVGLIDALDPGELERALAELPPSGFAWSIAARRAIRSAYEEGDLGRTRALVDRVEQAGLVLDDELRTLRNQAERREQVQPYAVGAILSLSGRDRALGQDALRGLMIAAGIPLRGPPRPDTFRLAVRDDTGDPERAAASVDELVREERVIAIVGPVSSETAAAAALRAQSLSVPIVLLADLPATAAEAGRFVLRASVSLRTESLLLARHAVATSRPRLVVLRPAGPEGDALAEQLRRSVAGAEIVADVAYANVAGGLSRAAQGMRTGAFDALIVVHDGRGGPRASHIAPALHSPSGEPRPTVSWTTASWDAAAVAALVREQPGAFLTRVSSPGPGTSGGEAELASAWSAQFGGDPGRTAHFAFDAFRGVRQVVLAGVRSRSDALATLLRSQFSIGATAGRSFDAAGRWTPAARVLRAVDGRLEPVPE